MLFLKQSTALQSDLLGAFVDEDDGKTAETGLTIANTDIRLSKNGGNMVAKNSGGGTHDEAGWYTVTYDATDTDTIGRLRVSVHVAGALPVWAEYQVLEGTVYDALFGSGAMAELTAAPSATPTFVAALMTLFMALRNKMDVTSSLLEVHNDAGTVVAKKTLTDDGTTYSEAKMVDGP